MARHVAFHPGVEALLDELEETYPPRCLRPGETVEDHLRYAGKVDLVQYIISRLRPGPEEE